MSLLAVADLTVDHGPIRAVTGLSFTLDEGEMLALVGPNGAGKSSTLNAVVNAAGSTAGSVHLDGQDIRGLGTDAIARRGVRLVPEGRRIFPGLTVAENLRAGETGADVTDEDRAAIFDLFPRLAERQHQLGWSLSGGEQQMLALGRALVARPRVLLVDEPSLGLAPKYVAAVFDAIRAAKDDGMSIVLVEQNSRAALALATRAGVLDRGRLIAYGEPDEIMADPAIVRAYLGGQPTKEQRP